VSLIPAVLVLLGLGVLLGGPGSAEELPAELEPLTVTSQPFPNRPPARVWPNLRRLLSAIQEIRRQWGPVQVLSAYRSPQVNAAVDGAPDSLHMQGRAVDFRLSTAALTWQIFDSWLTDSARVRGAIQEAIYYDGANPRIHLGLCSPSSCSGPRFVIRNA